MFAYAIDPTTNLATCRISGRLDFLEVTGALQQVIETMSTQRVANVLFVINDLLALETCHRYGTLLPLVRHWAERHPMGRWALVLPVDTAADLCKRALRTLELAVAACACFQTEDEARLWLQRGPTLPGDSPSDLQVSP